jgi:diguanylate cyclase (GGDEF)-like protein
MAPTPVPDSEPVLLRPAAATAPIRILLLEDSAADAELCERELAQSSLNALYSRVETAAAFTQALQEFDPHIILSDLKLPGFNGMDALRLAREARPEVPFIFVSGTIGEDRAVEAMRQGATDYVLKDRLQRLGPVVNRALLEAKQRAARAAAERELDVVRQQLDTIISSLVDVVWSESVPDHQMLFVSAATEAIYQRPPADFYHAPDLWMQVVHPADRDEVLQRWQRTCEGALFDAEYRIMRPDGTTRWIHDRRTPVFDEHGAVTRIDGLARDVTQRRLQQDKLERLSRIREVLTSVTAAIVHVRTRQELFEEACRIAVEYGKFRMAWVGIAHPEKRTLQPVAWYGLDDGYLNEVGQQLSIAGNDPGAAVRVLTQRSAVIVNDIAQDDRFVFKQAALKRGYRACALLPLFLGDEPAGVLTLFSGEAGIFDQAELELLSDLAGDIGLAMAYINQGEKLTYLAYHDALTGLCNRSLLYDRLSREIAHAQRRGRTVSVVFIDLDRFKVVNDSLGHSAGDELLKTTATRLSACLREHDTVARTGGDEFVVILSQEHEADTISSAIDRIRTALVQPIPLEGQQVQVGCSIGVSVYPHDGRDTDTLLKNADAAMYRAKDLGRNNLQFYASEMNARANDQLSLLNSLRHALERKEFFLHYQPQVDLRSGALVGVEALVRWAHPQFGVLAPSRFITAAEDSGLIIGLGEWVLRTACAQLKLWQAEGLTPIRMAVNLSGRELQGPSLLRAVTHAIEEVGIEPGQLELDITEGALMQHTDAALSTLRKLRDLGVTLALDDFGTGYSSLSFLKRFPLSRLKIDRAFVRDIESNPDDAAMVRGIVALAHNIRLRVLAEGVESPAQMQQLHQYECDEAQGYYFGRPVSAQHIAVGAWRSSDIDA